MKLTKHKFVAGFASLALLLGSAFISCNNGNTTDTETENPEILEEDKEDLDSTAFSIIRAFCDLSQYDENASVETASNGEKEYVGGVPTLPADWETREFSPTEGFVIREETPSVRYFPVMSADDARQFYAELIGTSETIIKEHQWSYAGLGRLTFTLISETGVNDWYEVPAQNASEEVKNSYDSMLYAVIDVDIPRIPDLKQVRLVPVDAITSENASNKFSGKPYYSAGDVIKRTKDSSVWMCVRPSGGDLAKDYSYWICLDPGTSNAYKSQKKSMKIKGYSETTTNDWFYANNLMSLTTAKAAYHTFSILLSHKNANLVAFDGAEAQYNKLKEKKIDILNLAETSMVGTDTKLLDPSTDPINFNFAYGKPLNDKSRKSSIAQVKYVQPFLCGTLSSKDETTGRNKEEIKIHLDGDVTSSYYSTTDAYDPTYTSSVLRNFSSKENTSKGYDFHNYLHSYDSTKGLLFNDYNRGWRYLDSKKAVVHVIFSPELKLKDNRGTASEAKKPSNDYEDIVRAGTGVDWWASLKKTDRYVDSSIVDWESDSGN